MRNLKFKFCLFTLVAGPSVSLLGRLNGAPDFICFTRNVCLIFIVNFNFTFISHKAYKIPLLYRIDQGFGIYIHLACLLVEQKCLACLLTQPFCQRLDSLRVAFRILMPEVRGLNPQAGSIYFSWRKFTVFVSFQNPAAPASVIHYKLGSVHLVWS